MRSRSQSLALACLGSLAACSGGGSSSGGADDSGGPPAPAGAFIAEDGLVVVEIESGDAAGDWAEETGLGGFSGASYVTWTGPDLYGTAGQDAFGFDFVIADAGRYHFRMHNRHDHADSTLANDLYVRMDGGAWVKAFSWQRGQWTWVTQHEFSHNDKPPAEYTLSAGNHRIEFSGRSNGFSVDRFHLYMDSVVNPMDLSHPQSARAAGLPVTSASLAPTTLPSDELQTELVELALTDEQMETSVESSAWTLGAGEFVDGSLASDVEATVVLPGGAFVPVERKSVLADGRETVDLRTYAPDGAQLSVEGELRAGAIISVTVDVASVLGANLESAELTISSSSETLGASTFPLVRIGDELFGRARIQASGRHVLNVNGDGRVVASATVYALGESSLESDVDSAQASGARRLVLRPFLSRDDGDGGMVSHVHASLVRSALAIEAALNERRPIDVIVTQDELSRWSLGATDASVEQALTVVRAIVGPDARISVR